MLFITDNQPEISLRHNIGNKAQNLFILKKLGFEVPKFIVITEVENTNIDIEIIEQIINYFPDNQYFAVRSSAQEEDGENYSFAGIFESYLYVKKENLIEKIIKVLQSAISERVKIYKKQHQLSENIVFPAVIVQTMLDATISGVAFGINILNNQTDEKIINAVWGLGEGLVSGELEADTFIIKANKEIKSEVVNKTQQISFNQTLKEGTQKTNVTIEKQKKPTLTHTQIYELNQVLNQLNKYFDKPQDIEFAIVENRLYLLQTRTITQNIGLKGVYTLWDNSNIIESYPHVTTPLTFSFISKSYQTAYSLFAEFLGVSPKVIIENETIFANTLGFLNGRVYYNLKSWYQMLAMLPSYQINARFMEKMMGVKERFDVPSSFKMNKIKAVWQVLKMGVNMFIKLKNLPKTRQSFVKLVDKIITDYYNIDFSQKEAHELKDLFIHFEKTLLNEWKAPLLNDFFAMIYFGSLQKMCEKLQLSTQNPNIHNDLLCGSQDIISTQPIHQTIFLAEIIQNNPSLKKIFVENNENEIWSYLSDNQIDNDIKNLKKEIDNYLSNFGERCVGELKLETISYSQEPPLFIKILKNYVIQQITSKNYQKNIENEIREKAEKQVKIALKGKFWQKRKFYKTLEKTRELVSQRENLRYERTRAFGIVRKIFINIGKKFEQNKLIEKENDIFYLTKEEIFAFIEGTSVTQNIKALIDLRKNEFEKYKQKGAISERFATYGIVYQLDNDFFSIEKELPLESELKGIGCCVGIVEAKVRVLDNPHQLESLKGDILVAYSTDPGWVVLFPDAKGILVERGSLLSHSAIVAREMGKPCIVGIKGLLKTLKTGDLIEMNGSTGNIRIIKN